MLYNEFRQVQKELRTARRERGSDYQQYNPWLGAGLVYIEQMGPNCSAEIGLTDLGSGIRCQSELDKAVTFCQIEKSRRLAHFIAMEYQMELKRRFGGWHVYGDALRDYNND